MCPTRTRSGIASIRLKYENSNRLLATVVLNSIEPEQDNAKKNNPKGKPEITVTPGRVNVRGRRCDLC